ncbi:MAG TPA: hypothetical protein P5064_06055 [Clostridia bacterium]|jgi:hypothetical protein|nr:hypothetical protein [Clostridia bacterium]HOM34166.1 hypothetical protein [Clostridia bacterium]HOR89831.1 hypothetical protein [Clostridia bacterium]HOT71226.1 hypothetical protein [Clostridia bacterium]HPL08137.1 hypothetical protein [Clostridia bacterium]
MADLSVNIIINIVSALSVIIAVIALYAVGESYKQSQGEQTV